MWLGVLDRMNPEHHYCDRKSAYYIGQTGTRELVGADEVVDLAAVVHDGNRQSYYL